MNNEVYYVDLMKVLIQDKEYFDLVHPFIKPEYFHFPILSDIYKNITTYYATYSDIPEMSYLLQTFVEEPTESYNLAKDVFIETVTECYQVPVPETHKKAIQQRVLGFIKKARYKDAFAQGYDDLRVGNYEKLLERFTQASDIVIEDADAGSFLAETLETRLQGRKEEVVVKGIPTGYKQFDERSRFRGVPKSTLNIVVAGTGVGKSILLNNLAVSAAKAGNVVIHFTLENSESETLDRYDALVSQTDINKLAFSQDRIREAYAKHFSKGMVVVKQYPAGQATVSTLRTYIKVFVKKYGIKPDMVVIDYADEMNIGKSVFSESRAIWQQHYTNLKGFAVEHNIVLWSATQGNTQSLLKDIVGKTDVAEGSSKLRPVDLAVSISESKEDVALGECNLFWMKCRFAEDGYTTHCSKNKKTMTIQQLEEYNG